MRRVRHLGFCDYIVPIGVKTFQPITQSHCTILLERTWHRETRDDFALDLHVKFNSDSIDGIQIKAQLLKSAKVSAMAIESTSLYRVSDASWVETLVASPTLAGGLGVFAGTVSQATLSTNELSGAEVYALEVVAIRKRRQFKKKVYFNHLGCFDSLNRLRNYVEYLMIDKVDD